MYGRNDIISYAEKLQGKADYPFEGDLHSAVLRRTNGKWFGVLLRAPEKYFVQCGVVSNGDKEVLNLKCPPDLQPFLRARYKGVLPAYHMNKNHWISILLNDSVPDAQIFPLLELSYDSVAPKRRKKHPQPSEE